MHNFCGIGREEGRRHSSKSKGFPLICSVRERKDETDPTTWEGMKTNTSICSIWGGAWELGQQDREGGSKEKD